MVAGTYGRLRPKGMRDVYILYTHTNIYSKYQGRRQTYLHKATLQSPTCATTICLPLSTTATAVAPLDSFSLCCVTMCMQRQKARILTKKLAPKPLEWHKAKDIPNFCMQRRISLFQGPGGSNTKRTSRLLARTNGIAYNRKGHD